MFEEIIENAKQALTGTLQTQHGLEPKHAEQTAGVIGNSFMNTIQEQIKGKDFSAITEIFSGTTTDANHNSIQQLIPGMKNELVTNAGLNTEQAGNIATSVLPQLFNMFNDKVVAAKQQGIDIPSLIQQFSGGGFNLGSMGSLMSMAGGFLKGGKQGMMQDMMKKFMG